MNYFESYEADRVTKLISYRKLTEQQIAHYYKSNSMFIRSQIASYFETNAEILKILSQDITKWVRRNVAQNENSTEEILRQLVEDDEYSITLARNKNCPADVLEKLSNKTEYALLDMIARHSNTPTEVLMRFTKDTDADLRYYAKKNLEKRGISID